MVQYVSTIPSQSSRSASISSLHFVSIRMKKGRVKIVSLLREFFQSKNPNPGTFPPVHICVGLRSYRLYITLRYPVSRIFLDHLNQRISAPSQAREQFEMNLCFSFRKVTLYNSLEDYRVQVVSVYVSTPKIKVFIIVIK